MGASDSFQLRGTSRRRGGQSSQDSATSGGSHGVGVHVLTDPRPGVETHRRTRRRLDRADALGALSRSATRKKVRGPRAQREGRGSATAVATIVLPAIFGYLLSCPLQIRDSVKPRTPRPRRSHSGCSREDCGSTIVDGVSFHSGSREGDRVTPEIEPIGPSHRPRVMNGLSAAPRSTRLRIGRRMSGHHEGLIRRRFESDRARPTG